MPYVGGSLTEFFDEAQQQLIRNASMEMADAGGEKIKEIAVINTPVETGELRRAWSRDPTVPEMSEGGASYRSRVANATSYAADVEYGTGLWGPKHAPYVILPKNPGGFLRFVGRDGNIVFAKSVLHPGSPGNHMLAIAMDVTQFSVESGVLFRDILEAWVREAEATVR